MPQKIVGIKDAGNLRKAFEELETRPAAVEIKVEEHKAGSAWDIREERVEPVTIKEAKAVKNGALKVLETPVVVVIASEQKAEEMKKAVEPEHPIPQESAPEPIPTPVEEEEVPTSSEIAVQTAEVEEETRAEQVACVEPASPEAADQKTGITDIEEGGKGPEASNEIVLETVAEEPVPEIPDLEDVHQREEPTITVSSNTSDDPKELRLVEVERGSETAEVSRPSFPGLGGVAPAGLLSVGIVAYLVIIGLTAMGALDIAFSVGGGAITSALVIYGAFVSYPSLKGEDSSVVFICPQCHEKVDRDKKCCPACGAAFSSED